MALLSEVTHQRLDQRRAGDEQLQEEAAGASRLAAFEGFVRCAAASTAVCSRLAGETVWTGEQDGSIAVRYAANGQIGSSLQRKKDVHATCLLPLGVYMWCGLSDGYVRIYDQETLEFCYEVKQHAGAVCAMVGLGNTVFTGSNDWQIIQWDARNFRYVEQFSGHSNAVLCLAVSGRCLFSGGDDCTIRCWDLDTGRAHEGRWPLQAHKGSVRAIVLNDIFLFSASADGTFKVWHSKTGELLRFLDHREGALTTLARDPVTRQIWCGGVDGAICVWDSASLQLTARLQGHPGTYCNLLATVCRASAMKAWSVTADGFSRIWFAETGTVDAQFEHLLDQERDLQQTVSEMRTTVICNYDELEQRKAQLRRIESVSGSRRAALGQTFGYARHRDLLRTYYLRLLTWDVRTHRGSVAFQVSELMQSHTLGKMLAVYFARLVRFRRMCRDDRRKDSVTASLLSSRALRLRRTYWGNLVAYTRREARRGLRDMAAAMLAGRRDWALRIRFWQHLCGCVRARRRRQEQGRHALALLRFSSADTRAAYWHKLQDAFRCDKHFQFRSRLAGPLAHLTRTAALSSSYRRWAMHAGRQSWTAGGSARLITRRRRPRQGAMAAFLQVGTDRGVLQLYFHRLQRHTRRARRAASERALQRREDENTARAGTLALGEHMTDEEVDQEVARQEELLRVAAEQHAQRQAVLADLAREKAALRRTAFVPQMELDQSMTPTEQFAHVMKLLKGRAIHADADFELLSELQQNHSRGGPEWAAAAYKAGLNKVKAALERHNLKEHGLAKPDTFPPGKEVWTVVLGDDDRFISRNREREAANGVRSMVFAMDCMADSEQGASAEHSSETVANAGLLLDIVLSMDKRRRRKRGPGSPHSSPGRRARSPDGSSGRRRPPSRGQSPSDRSTSQRSNPAPSAPTPVAAAAAGRPSSRRSGSSSGRPSPRRPSPRRPSPRRPSPRPRAAAPAAAAAAPGGGPPKQRPPSRPRTRNAAAATAAAPAPPAQPAAARSSSTGQQRAATRSSSAASAARRSPARGPAAAGGGRRTPTRAPVPTRPAAPAPAPAPAPAGVAPTSGRVSARGASGARSPAAAGPAAAPPPAAGPANGHGPAAPSPALSPRPERPSRQRSGASGRQAAARQPPEQPPGSARRSSVGGSTPWLGLGLSKGAAGSACECGEPAAGGPAAIAGLCAGDIITAINGDRCPTRADFSAVLRKYARVGSRLRIAYTRQGRSATASLTVQAAPEGK